MGCSTSKADGGAQNTNKPEDKKEETGAAAEQTEQTEQTEQQPAGTVPQMCSYLFRVKSRSHWWDYRILDLDLVESIVSLLFIIDLLFEWWKYIVWPFKLNLNKICVMI